MPGTMIDRAGVFQARPMEWSVSKSPKEGSRATRVSVRYAILREWNDEDEKWVDWPEGYEVYGDHWVIKADGTPNGHAVGSLVRSLGWSGKFEDVGRTPSELGLTDCRIEVEEDIYDGVTRFRVQWLNRLDWEPKQMEGMEPNELKDLDTKSGAAMRAIVGAIEEHDKDIPF